MFHDLDSTLKAIIEDSAAPADLRNADVSFQTPRATFQPAGPTINFYLYHIEENREYRDPVPEIVRTNGQFTRRMPPVRADCSYVLTAWSTLTGEAQVAEEHRLLGLAFAWLRRFPIIPPAFLQGMLTGQPYDPLTLVAQMDGQVGFGDFWSALGIPPRPSISVIVTVAVELDSETPEGPPVDTHQLRIGLRDESTLLPQFISGTVTEYYRIGGTVRAGGNPVDGATVTIDELPGWQSTTNSDGHYQFASIPTGSYTLRASAPAGNGNSSVTVTDTVLEGYDIDIS